MSFDHKNSFLAQRHNEWRENPPRVAGDEVHRCCVLHHTDEDGVMQCDGITRLKVCIIRGVASFTGDLSSRFWLVILWDFIWMSLIGRCRCEAPLQSVDAA